MIYFITIFFFPLEKEKRKTTDIQYPFLYIKKHETMNENKCKSVDVSNY
jgi:hypothetical protein